MEIIIIMYRSSSKLLTVIIYLALDYYNLLGSWYVFLLQKLLAIMFELSNGIMTIMRTGVRTNSPESPSHAYPHSW